MPRKIVPFKIGDYVSFHTQFGKTTGIIEDIYLTRPFRTAYITVREMGGKPRKYHRPLFKLRKVEL
jgi:hypothetical protein